MYSTGSAADLTALITAFVSFATANAGYTLHASRSETISGLLYDVRALEKGGIYTWIRWRADNLYMLMSTGTGASWGTITGKYKVSTNDVETQIWPIQGPYTSYHLFTDGIRVFCAAERSNGSYQHFGIGSVNKFSAWTGGEFCVGQYFNTSQNLSFNTNVHGYMFGTGPTQTVGGSAISPTYQRSSSVIVQYGSRLGVACQWTPQSQLTMPSFFYTTGVSKAMLDGPILNSPNSFNGRTVLFPVICSLYDNDGGSNLLMPLGDIPNLRIVNIANLNPKDTVNTDWMVFPLNIKNQPSVPDQYIDTGDYGWAYKK